MLEGEYGKVAGAKSGGIAGDDFCGAGLEVATEMLGGFQSDVAVFVDVGAGCQKGSVVKGLIAGSADDNIHVADADSCRFSHSGAFAQKSGVCA